MPSFRKKDLNDEFWFVGRLKEQVLQTKEFARNDGSGTFTKVSLRVVHERLDAEAVSPRYSFFPVPEDQVRTSSPLGRYITAMETCETPVEFGGGSFEDANNALEDPLGTIYVCVQKSVGQGRQGKDPDRFVFPYAKIGFGTEWDIDEAKRIIAEARGISPNGVVKDAQPVKTAVAAGVPQTAEAPAQETLNLQNATMLENWKELLVPQVAGQPLQQATVTATAYVNQNRSSIPNGAQTLIEVLGGESFWKGLESEGLIQIVDGVIQAA